MTTKISIPLVTHNSSREDVEKRVAEIEAHSRSIRRELKQQMPLSQVATF